MRLGQARGGATQSNFRPLLPRNLSWVHTEAKREALGSTLRMTALPGSERQYLDAMGLLSGKQERGKEQNFTVDMRAFNEHTLSGKYHAFRIKNKFPIPGGAVADDFYRRALVEQNASAAKTIREKAEQRARHVDMATKVHEKKTRIALPTRIERLVRQVDEAIVEHDAHKQEAADTLVVMEGAPDEVKKVFGLIRARKVLELEEMFLQGEINVNMVEPTLYYTGLILACGKGLLTIAKVSHASRAHRNPVASLGARPPRRHRCISSTEQIPT